MNTDDSMPNKKPALVAAAFLLAIILVWLFLALWPRAVVSMPAQWMAKSNGAFLVLAHQGGAMERPSESNLAFEHAAAIGVDAFELDVALTSDGILAVIHDTSLDRTTDGTGLVRNKTYAEIRFLDAGYGLLDADGRVIRDPAANPYIGRGAYVPSLEELFRTYPGMHMLIELKDKGELGALAATELRRLIDAYGRADRTLVASFHGEVLEAFDALEGQRIMRAASTPEVYRFYILHVLNLHALNNNIAYQALSMPLMAKVGPLSIDLLAERLRRDISRRGLAAYYWTINDASTMDTLVRLASDARRLGPAGVITDRPSALIAALRRGGLR